LGPLLSSFQSSLLAGSPLAYALAFLGGLLVSFTPCVYPILPVTVGFIGSRCGRSRRHALLLSAAYAVGMALTYAVLGMAAGLSGSVFGEATSHPLSYLVLGNICILFSANDAYMRDLNVFVPADCVVSNTADENRHALDQMRKVLKADITASTELDLDALRRSSADHQRTPRG